MARKPTWGTPTPRRALTRPLRKRWRSSSPPPSRRQPLARHPRRGASGRARATAVSPGIGHGRATAASTRAASSATPPARASPTCAASAATIPPPAGRLTASAHVLFGSADPRKAAAAPDLACATLPRRAQGAERVDQRGAGRQCAQCHFGSLRRHPEFAVLRASTAEAPGMNFGHEKHIEEVKKAQGLTAAAQTCATCHQKSQPRRDFEPISFDQHCASLPRQAGLGGGDGPGAPHGRRRPRRAEGARRGRRRAASGPRSSRSSRGKVARPSVRHRDPWVLFNLDKLRAESDPEGLRAASARGWRRASPSLERRLAAATPFASLDRAALEQRAAALERESEGATPAPGRPVRRGRREHRAWRGWRRSRPGCATTDAAAADEVVDACARPPPERAARARRPCPPPTSRRGARRSSACWRRSRSRRSRPEAAHRGPAAAHRRPRARRQRRRPPGPRARPAPGRARAPARRA